jgi:hypothetical protein
MDILLLLFLTNTMAKKQKDLSWLDEGNENDDIITLDSNGVVLSN